MGHCIAPIRDTGESAPSRLRVRVMFEQLFESGRGLHAGGALHFRPPWNIMMVGMDRIP